MINFDVISGGLAGVIQRTIGHSDPRYSINNFQDELSLKLKDKWFAELSLFRRRIALALNRVLPRIHPSQDYIDFLF